MLTIKRTDAFDDDFINLVEQLDKELSLRDGKAHDFYHQFNGLHHIKHAVVAYKNNEPVACGALKEYELNTMEVKRMFTIPAYRGQGIGTRVLQELEDWATGMTYNTCILETGLKQPEAIGLYLKNGFTKTKNYAPYIDVENSICFKKDLRP